MYPSPTTHLLCPWGHLEEILGSFGGGLGEHKQCCISEELHLIFMAVLGSYGEGHWPQLNSFISNSILIRKAQWFAGSSQSSIRIKYCSLNDIYYYSANFHGFPDFFFFFILLVLLYSGYFLGQTCLFLGVQGCCARLKELHTGRLDPGHASVSLGYWLVWPGSSGLTSQGLSFLVKIKGNVGELRPSGS